MFHDLVEFGPPFYLLISSAKCGRCRERHPVAGLASGNEEPFMLSHITGLPEEVLAAIHRIHPRFELRLDYRARTSYFLNICPCGSYFSDHELFDDAGGAFFPLSEEQAREIEVHELPLTGGVRIDCCPGMGTGGVILKHGRRISVPS